MLAQPSELKGKRKMIYKEIITYSDYTINKQTESKLIPGMIINRWDYYLECPRCKARLAGIPHGCNRLCASCNLNMQRFGNALYIWEGQDNEYSSRTKRG